ncbi:MAG: metallophosphoesterase [Lentimicrobium sp.]|jgi:Icc-related predicted phosphoesterase|nr:metallophosphoesterase [Lentimicrobium sp.]
MKIQYASDLHLEFEHNSKHLANYPLKVCGEVLVLAGDIIPLQDVHLNHAFFSFVSTHYEKVFWVPGNHEFYHNDMAEFKPSFNIQLRDNIHIVNNIALDYKGINFIFSTLWSHISKPNEKIIEQGVADFDYITVNGKKFRSSDYNKLHRESLDFLEKSLTSSSKKTVVVTHHLPSQLCNAAEHSGSKINEAFCVDLTEFIQRCKANFWIYGHSHFNQKPLFIGDTILITNQLGMVQSNEHTHFNPKAFFSV